MKKFLKILISLIILVIIIEVGLNLYKRIYEEIHYNPNTSWTITSYGDNADLQMMSFTIEGNDHGLIIVDGGYRARDKVSLTKDIEVLDEVIKKHDGIIDAWILTHFDEDHAGVFDYFVMTKQDEIEIKKYIRQMLMYLLKN